MTTFTIDTENNITAFVHSDQVEPIIAAGAEPFATSEELTQLAAAGKSANSPDQFGALQIREVLLAFAHADFGRQGINRGIALSVFAGIPN